MVLFSPVALAKAATMAKYVTGEILIKYKDSATSLAAISRLNSSLGVSKQQAFKSVRIQHVRLPAYMKVEEAIEYYEQDPNVEYAEPNYIVHASALPDDPDLIALWGLKYGANS